MPFSIWNKLSKLKLVTLQCFGFYIGWSSELLCQNMLFPSLFWPIFPASFCQWSQLTLQAYNLTVLHPKKCHFQCNWQCKKQNIRILQRCYFIDPHQTINSQIKLQIDTNIGYMSSVKISWVSLSPPREYMSFNIKNFSKL